MNEILEVLKFSLETFFRLGSAILIIGLGGFGIKKYFLDPINKHTENSSPFKQILIYSIYFPILIIYISVFFTVCVFLLNFFGS